MISTLTGTIMHVGLTTAVVDVQGLGYTVHLTAQHAAGLTAGDSASIHTTLIKREDSLAIYGFQGTAERALFDQLTTVTGVGPRHALAALSTADVNTMARAIANDNDLPFRKVPGIGPKTARTIVMTLKNKIHELLPDHDQPNHRTPPTGTTVDAADRRGPPRPAAAINTPARAEAGAALLGLGWNKRTVNATLEGIFTDDPTGAEHMSTAALIRAGLTRLARQ